MSDDLGRRILVALQDGLPLTATPYRDAAEELGISEAELLDRLRGMLEAGLIRRMGASLAHRRVGYAANAMVIWDVDDDQMAEIGPRVASFEEVSHCYERPRASGWRYNLYAMIHGAAEEECEAVVRRIESGCGLSGGILAYSRQEFKKTWSRLE